MSLHCLIRVCPQRGIILLDRETACQPPAWPSNAKHLPRRHLNSFRLCKPHKQIKIGSVSSRGLSPSSAVDVRNTFRSFSTSPKRGTGIAWEDSRLKRALPFNQVPGRSITTLPQTMDSITESYRLPSRCHVIPTHLLDLRPDPDIDQAILNPPPITSSEKNIWFYWSTGYSTMHNCSKRNVRSWYRRFSKQGWTIRVLDRAPDSPSNVENFLNTKDSGIFPRVFIDGQIGGEFGPQYTSDFVRFPLLLKYGGVYADVGVMQIGDLDLLWNETIGNPDSRFEVVSYNRGGVEGRSLSNYFMASGRGNPFFKRCHKLFLAVWNENGGRITTEGMHASPLLTGIPLMKHHSEISLEHQKELTDYHTHEQVMTAVMGLIDEDDDWNGPKYVAEKVYGIEDMEYSQLINEYTSWDGHRAFELMSLRVPTEGEVENADQKLARTIVEICLQKSFAFKLAHGMIVKVSGETLGSLWRANDGSDNVPGTYSHWLRYGMAHWNQNELPPSLDFRSIPPTKVGPLLSEF